MTRDEAIDFGKTWVELQEDDSKGSSTYDFFVLALKALEREQKIAEIIAIDNSVIELDVMKYKMICEVMK